MAGRSEATTMNNEYEWEWDWHNGSRVRVPRKREKVRHMMRRLADLDAARIAAGEQDAFLNSMDALPVAQWQDKYFNRRGR
jgi:hypothetical protein